MHIKDKQYAINKVAEIINDNGIFELSTEKNQNDFIDTGISKIKVYPDKPDDTKKYLENANFIITQQFETQFAYIYIAKERV